ncbi:MULTISPECIES: hypothetical protein [Trichocoleus]|uniref:Uncharacterized protein n=1 Tax=Trichocoleus desertorum GB2-A4 TaxID=2933944 RepID=A0ABV0J1H1_9CYAN|nr:MULTISPECIES: hypothetical protein [unclassified Trichocoleus]MBD1860229.1 hypothetical protein [Trichocoleus sp. FACHB-46]MBD2097786.1 hypothetical protein [Trichocoleus sp. FACHB-591]MBD2120040.1 hypothetical protein [Trichocoleus sp. FACHB-262]
MNHKDELDGQASPEYLPLKWAIAPRHLQHISLFMNAHFANHNLLALISGL